MGLAQEKVMKANPKLGAYFDGEVDAAQKARALQLGSLGLKKEVTGHHSGSSSIADAVVQSQARSHNRDAACTGEVQRRTALTIEPNEGRGGL